MLARAAFSFRFRGLYPRFSRAPRRSKSHVASTIENSGPSLYFGVSRWKRRRILIEATQSGRVTDISILGNCAEEDESIRSWRNLFVSNSSVRGKIWEKHWEMITNTNIHKHSIPFLRHTCYCAECSRLYKNRVVDDFFSSFFLHFFSPPRILVLRRRPCDYCSTCRLGWRPRIRHADRSAIKATFKTKREAGKMFYFDDGAVAKVNIGFPFVYKAAGNDRTRGGVMKASWSEVRKLRPSIYRLRPYGGPRARARARARWDRCCSAPAARAGEGARWRASTVDARGHGFTIRNTREK